MESSNKATCNKTTGNKVASNKVARWFMLKGIVKKKITRIVGLITVLALALIIAVVMTVAATATPTAQAVGNPLRVAVFIGDGAQSDKVVATLRACQACGFAFYGIGLDDIAQGRLTAANYDVLLLPDGCDDSTQWYASSYGFTTAEENSIKVFVSGGGGMVGLGSGAQYMSSGTGNLAVYNTAYTKDGAAAGKNTITYTDSSFGSGDQELYRTAAGGYWAAQPGGGTQVATYGGNTVVGCATYGSGHVAVCSLEPELRGDSELDWTIWDNWAMSSTQTNSVGGWSLIGHMINYAATGTASAPTITETANPAGARVAIYGTYTYVGGGAYSGLLPGIARSVEAAGDVPLVVRADDINGYLYPGVDTLTTANFQALICGGGYAFGYKQSLGTNGGVAIKKFATAGGGVMGICAGAYYLCNSIYYDGSTYPYLGLFAGEGRGELTDIASYPSGAMTKVNTSDAVIGNLGTGDLYYAGGPYFTNLAASSATQVATYAYSGLYAGDVEAIRFMYGSGHVLLSGCHPEVLNGSNDDWMTWDNYVEDGTAAWVNPDLPYPRTFFVAALNNWVAPSSAPPPPVLPTVTSDHDSDASWHKTAVTVTLPPVDTGGPGIGKTQYRLSGSSTWLDAASNKFVVAAPAKHSNDGKHTYEYRALDVNGISSVTHTCTLRIDTTGPTTAGKTASGKKGHAIRLKYRITDKLSSKATAVVLTVRSAKGKLVKSFKLGTMATKKWLSVKWTPKAKGSYRYSITAKDLAGNRQTKAPVSKIKVE